MIRNSRKTEQKHPLILGRPGVLPLMLVLVSLLYVNSLNCSWHFDDVQNILTNTALHLDSLSLSSIKETFFAHPNEPGTLYRPVSCLFFALNWLVGQDNVLGYHVVNLAIHLIATAFLFQTILLILRSPALSCHHRNEQYFIAAFAALLWAVNPVQTQAVTYIVQRMTSLAAMFYIIGLWSYLFARSNRSSNIKTIALFVLCFAAFIFALGSKENAILFPFSLMLIEFIFFPKATFMVHRRFIYLALGNALIIILAFISFGTEEIGTVLASYSDRSYSVTQRVLTESRIVIWYISLLFIPTPNRLSIEHYVPLSTSLFSPLSTLAAIIVLFAAITFSLSYRRRFPLLSFSILFYLLNHLVESTIIPLELVFEHRNYLPSLFIFVPLAAAIVLALRKYQHNSLKYCSVIGLSATLMLLYSVSTIERNQIWKTEIGLWTDAMNKAPQNARPYINLAYNYQYEGYSPTAFNLYHSSLDKHSPSPWKDRFRAYNSMGRMMAENHHHDRAIRYFDSALSALPAQTKNRFYIDTVYVKTVSQWIAGREQLALSSLIDLQEAFPLESRFLKLYGDILISQGQLEEGLKKLRQSLRLTNRASSHYPELLLSLSLVYGKQRNFPKASFYHAFAEHLGADETTATLCLLENSVHAGKTHTADQAITQLLASYSWYNFMNIFDNPPTTFAAMPISYPLLKQYSIAWLTDRPTL